MIRDFSVTGLVASVTVALASLTAYNGIAPQNRESKFVVLDDSYANEDISKVAGKIDIALASQATMGSAITQAIDSNRELGKAISELSKMVAQSNQASSRDIAMLTSTVAKLNEKTEQIEKDGFEAAKKLPGVEDNFDTLSNRVKTLEEEVESLKAKFSGAQTVTTVDPRTGSSTTTVVRAGGSGSTGTVVASGSTGGSTGSNMAATYGSATQQATTYYYQTGVGGRLFNRYSTGTCRTYRGVDGRVYQVCN